jgi:hypothetical protein
MADPPGTDEGKGTQYFLQRTFDNTKKIKVLII